MLRRLLSTAPFSLDLGLLLLRVTAGGTLLLFHGLSKLTNFAERKETFSDPLGVGSTFSLSLVVFAEFFCSALIILGAYTRLALIPLIINMSVIMFIVHGDDPLKERELPLFFLSSFITLFLTGPGKMSVDGMMKR
jgi:putative oxidoreductase